MDGLGGRDPVATQHGNSTILLMLQCLCSCISYGSRTNISMFLTKLKTDETSITRLSCSELQLLDKFFCQRFAKLSIMHKIQYLNIFC